MVPGAQATKKKETQEQALVRMVGKISEKLKNDNPEGADQLGWIIGKKDMGSTERDTALQDFWRHDSNAYMQISFPTHLRKDFDALQKHLKEMGIGARIDAGRDLIIIGAQAKPREGAQEVINQIEEEVLEPQQEEPQPLVPMPAAAEKAAKEAAEVITSGTEELAREIMPEPRQSDTPALDLLQAQMMLLKNLLTAPAPKNNEEKAERLDRLLEIYRDPQVRNQFYDDLSRAQNLKSSLKKGIENAAEAQTAREELSMLESEVLPLYKQFFETMQEYAKTPEQKQQVSEARRIFWSFNHNRLLRYSTSIDNVVAQLERMRVREGDLRNVEQYLNHGLNPRVYPAGHDIPAGAGTPGEKRAKRIMDALKKSGLVDSENLRTSYSYENWKKIWRVELGSEYACASSRAAASNRAGGSPPIPMENARDFQDQLDKIFAHRIGDDTLAGNPVFAHSYEQMRALGAEERQYQLTFINRKAAEEFYNIINDYGPMYGISILPQKGKDFAQGKDKMWAIIASFPRIAGVEERGTIPTDPLASVSMRPEPEVRAEVSQEGSDMRISDVAKAWMKKQYKIDFGAFEKKYIELKEGYDANPAKNYSDWSRARGQCEEMAGMLNAAISSMEAAQKEFREGGKFASESAAFNQHLSALRQARSKLNEALEKATERANYFKGLSPDKVSTIPREMEGRYSHLEHRDRAEAVSAYKEGREWRHRFGEARHARRVEEWLLAHNFEGISRRGSTLVIEANPARARKAEEAEPTPQEQYMRAVLGPQPLDYEQKQMLDHIYEHWAGENSNFLAEGNYAWSQEYSGTERALILEALVRQVPARQLRNLLLHIEGEAYALMTQRPLSTAQLSIYIPKESNPALAIEGIRLLFMAKGLTPPRFRANLRTDRGRRQIRAIGQPELYVRPSSEFRFPEPNEAGEVLVSYRNATVAISAEDARRIEAALREGKEFEAMVYRPARAGGWQALRRVGDAAILAGYLRERGWDNLGIKPWKEGGARSMLYSTGVPEGYWNRPEGLFAVEARDLLDQPSLLAQAAKARERAEWDALGFSPSGEYSLSLDPSGRRILGAERYGAVIDTYPEYLTREPEVPRTPRQEEIAEIRRMLVNRDYRGVQARELPKILNIPGYETWIGYQSPYVANNAARWLQDALIARGDHRTVTVHSRGFMGLPHFRIHYLVVSSPSENQFENRGTSQIPVPHSYSFIPEGATNPKSISLGNNPADRVALEALLNGREGRSHTFYLGRLEAEAMERYLFSIGAAGIATTEIIPFSSIPEAERERKIDWLDTAVYAVTLNVPPAEEAMALGSRERGVLYRNLEMRIRSDIPVDARNIALKRIQDRILRYAKHENQPREDEFIVFGDRLGGEETARRFQEILSAYPELIGVYLEGNTLLVRRGETSEGVEAELGMRGDFERTVRAAREEYLRSHQPAVEDAVSRGIEEYARRLRQQGRDIIVSSEPLSSPGNVHQFFYDLDPAKHGQDTVNFNTANTAGQISYQAFWREPRFALLNRIANLEFAELPSAIGREGRNFPRSAAVRVMRDLHILHTGVGQDPSKSPDRIYGHEKAGVMYDVLSYAYRDWASFARELEPSFAAGLAAGSHYYTEQIVNRNINYHSMSVEDKREYYNAVFEVVWRSTVSQMAHECGFFPSHRLFTPQEHRDYAKNVLIPHLTGTHPNATFTIHEGTAREQTYRVMDRRLVTSGREGAEVLLTLPIEGDPLHVTVVGYADLRGVPHLRPESEWAIRRIKPFDSLGALGATPRYRTGGYTFRLTEREREEEPEREEELVTITTDVDPMAYLSGRPIPATWEIVWKRDDLIFAMRQGKELMDELKKEGTDPRVSYVVSRPIMRGNELSVLILPPRNHYDMEGVEVRQTTSRRGYPAGAYASAYADTSGNLYVFRHKDPQKRREHAKNEGYPLNARELYHRDETYLTGKGIERVQIGSYDSVTGKIRYTSTEYENEYEKHLVGHIRLTPSSMSELGEREVRAFQSVRPIDYDADYNYFKIDGLEAGAARRVEAFVNTGSERGTAVRMQLIGTNVPSYIETVSGGAE